MNPNELSTSTEEQGTESSIEDIASLMGDANAEAVEDDLDAEEGEQVEVAQDGDEEEAEEADDGEQEAAVDEDPEYDVDVGGEKARVRLSELKSGYMKDADYRRKTAQLSESTRAVEQERQFIRQERDQRVNQIDALATVLYQELVGEQAQLDDLLDSDPAAYLRVKRQIERKHELLQQAGHARHTILQQQQADQERERDTYSKEERAKLTERLPEWRDTKVKQAESNAIAQYLGDIGYSGGEIAELLDHRALLVARDAMLYRAQKQVKTKQVQTPPRKPVRPGVANSPNENQIRSKAADDRYRRNPDSLEALAGVLGSRGL